MGASHIIVKKIRFDFYDHLQKLPLSYYQRLKTGDYMSRATNDMESIRMAIGPGVLVAVDAVLMVALIVPAMIWLSPKLTLYTFIFFPLAPIVTKILGKKIEVLFDLLQNKLSEMSAFTQEIFSSIRLVKSLVLESSSKKQFEQISEQYQKQGLKLAKSEALFSPILGLITNLGLFFILWIGGVDVMTGVMTVGTFVAFQRFVAQLSWPMEAVGWAVTMHQEGVAAYHRVLDIFNVPVVNSVVHNAEKNKSEYLLTISHLKHQFGAGSPFSLEIDKATLAQGEKIGIVGEIGSGKSTLFSLLQRLYEPNAGAIFLGGRDILSIPIKELRANIVSVEQQINLFNDTVFNNVVLGDETIPKEKVVDVLKICEVFQEVQNMPHQLETIVGERGITLSGGQKQRIALARALIKEPLILLLDDCFSAIDVEVERKIIDNLLKSYPNITLLFSSHRLSLMPLLDNIWVFGNGKLISQGKHGSLLKQLEYYNSLWSKSEQREIQSVI
jgi:ATP-binding cassette subfamily B protein